MIKISKIFGDFVPRDPAFARAISRRSAILKIVEEKALGTRLSWTYLSGSALALKKPRFAILRQKEQTTRLRFLLVQQITDQIETNVSPITGCVSLKKCKIGFLNPKESENGFCVSLLINPRSINLFSKETHNPFSDFFGFKSPIKKRTHSSSQKGSVIHSGSGFFGSFEAP